MYSSSSARYDGSVPCRHKNSKLELDSLRCSQPVQLAEERSDVVIPSHSINTFHMHSLLCHLSISLPLSHTQQEKTCYLLTYESEHNFCEQRLNKKPLTVRPSFSSSDLCIWPVLDLVALSSCPLILLDCQSKHTLQTCSGFLTKVTIQYAKTLIKIYSKNKQNNQNGIAVK